MTSLPTGARNRKRRERSCPALGRTRHLDACWSHQPCPPQVGSRAPRLRRAEETPRYARATTAGARPASASDRAVRRQVGRDRGCSDAWRLFAQTRWRSRAASADAIRGVLRASGGASRRLTCRETYLRRAAGTYATASMESRSAACPYRCRTSSGAPFRCNRPKSMSVSPRWALTTRDDTSRSTVLIDVADA